MNDISENREMFEAWITKDCGDLTTFGHGANMHYRNSAVNNAWYGWQASRVALESEKLQAQQQEINELKAKQVAAPVVDMFWNHDDPEKPYSSISEFLNDEMCNGTELTVGDIRTVQRALRLPNIDIRITSINEDECDADYEIVATSQGDF